jgi:hypothetical protein
MRLTWRFLYNSCKFIKQLHCKLLIILCDYSVYADYYIILNLKLYVCQTKYKHLYNIGDGQEWPTSQGVWGTPSLILYGAAVTSAKVIRTGSVWSVAFVVVASGDVFLSAIVEFENILIPSTKLSYSKTAIAQCRPDKCGRIASAVVVVLCCHSLSAC